MVISVAEDAGSKPKPRKRLDLHFESSPFTAYTNPNAPVITVVKNSGAILDAEFINATPDSLALPLEFIIDEESLDIPEEEQDQSTEVKKPQKPLELDPREYQLELLEKAIKENIIAVLDTGSGKTLIAVMLIKEMDLIEKQERETRRKTKIAVFLVDRVPLVFQQKDVISTNCDLNVKHLCGEMVWDQWNAKMWETMTNEDDVCVMTAQIFLDALRHGFIHLDRINLMIFDECHHATKNHAFNMIMREFYQRCPENDRPKVFGMTASPMNSRESVEKSSYQLETNLNAKIFTAQNLTALKSFVNSPTEIVVEYTPPSNKEIGGLSRELMRRFYGERGFKELFKAIQWTDRQLGPYCSDLLCQKWFEEFGLFVDVAAETIFDEIPTDQEQQAQWEVAMQIAKDYRLPEMRTEDSTLFSNKIQRLLQILQIYKTGSDSFCGIIFVQRRHTAYVLKWLIDSVHGFDRFKTSILTGSQSQTTREAKMRFKNQNRVISAFRRGEINLLIATNVAEEGLDIQPCNLVIRFDFFSTLISYVQSRGRARQKDSRYIIMMELGNTKQDMLLRNLRIAERDVRAWCNELPEDRKARAGEAISDDPYWFFGEEEDDDDEPDDFFLVPSTKAVITLNSSVALVHYYCSTLPADSYCSLQPEFKYGLDGLNYTCTLTLPSNAAVQETFTEVANSKKLAKKQVAMKACIALYHAKGLNDHLMPIVVTTEMLGDMIPQRDANGDVIGSRKRRKVYKKKTPWFWEKGGPKEAEAEVFNEDEDPNLVLSSQNVWLSLNGDQPPSHANAKTEQATEEDVSTKAVHDDAHVHKLPSAKVEKSPGRITVNGEMDQELACEAQDSSAVQEEPLYPDTLSLYMTYLKHNLNDGYTDRPQYRDVCLLTHKPLPPIPSTQLYLHRKTTGTIVDAVSIPGELVFDLKTVDKLRQYTLKVFSAISNKTWECDLDATAYFVVPIKAKNEGGISVESIDWVEIDLLVEEQTLNLELDQLDNYLDRMIVDLSDSFRRYFIHQICHDLTPASSIPADYQGREVGYKSFADYYDKVLNRVAENSEQPMIQVGRITKVLNYLSPVDNAEALPPKRTAQYVIPEFCQLYPLSASVYRTMMLLPSIMLRIDSMLLIKEVNDKLETTIDDTLLLEAFTTPSANMDKDYERLETLGDSFLKFIATIRLFIMFPQSHEGQLHCQRIRIICNKALYRAARRLQLYKHITSQPFNRRRWRPPHFKTSEEDEEDLRIKLRRHELSDKTLADIVEATLGAAYLSGGVELGLKAAIALQVPFDHITKWSQFNETFLDLRAHLRSPVKAQSVKNLKLEHLAQITGYRFQNPLLVVEALTHASLPNSTVPCYQRLEFLGDGILDFLVVRYLFHKYPGYEPGRMTDMKDACVNNRVLGVICLEIGLNKHIIHFSNKLVGAITQFSREVDLIKDGSEDIGEYWSDLDVPKVLSDVVESILGAIFVDSGFNFGVVEASFEFFMRPFFDKHIQMELLKVHPLKTLTTGLQKLHCDGLLLRNHCTKRDDNMSQKCVVFLHNKAIASASSHNIREARKQAAVHAIAYLEDNLHIIPDLCDCGVNPHDSFEDEIEDEEEEDDDDE